MKIETKPYSKEKKEAIFLTSLKNEPRQELVKQLNGFDCGLEPKEITGATHMNGQLTFIMKWIDSDRIDLVPSKKANQMCPQIVIQFYEKHLKWNNSK